MGGRRGPPGLGAAALTVVIFVTLLGPGLADAHGREVEISVSCSAPDPGRPLIKACLAFLRYGDGDPVGDARLEATGTRQGGATATFGPAAFEALDQDGAYSATVLFPAYGTWRMRFVVRGPGRGEAELREEVLPPVPGDSSQIRGQLQVVFSFGPADVRNLVIRVAHGVGTLAWLGSVVLVLVALTFGSPVDRPRLLRRLWAIFRLAAVGGLLVVAASGILNAVYNTPTRPPGLLDPGTTATLPLGRVYVAMFVVKMALVAAIVAATSALWSALRRASRLSIGVTGDVTGAMTSRSPELLERRVRRLAAMDLGLGLLVLLVVVLMGYLHVITHVGGAAGAS